MVTTHSAQAQKQISILAWRGCTKNTLLGFLDVRLASGLVIRRITVHEKGGRRWIGLPARPYETSGSTSWIAVVEIPERETRERFERLVLEALDGHLEMRR
jgi:hypothetical protein